MTSPSKPNSFNPGLWGFATLVPIVPADDVSAIRMLAIALILLGAAGLVREWLRRND